MIVVGQTSRKLLRPATRHLRGQRESSARARATTDATTDHWHVLGSVRDGWQVSSHGAGVVTAARRVGVAISRRDRQIVELALRKLGGAGFDFGDALRALREATEELIPNGRVYFLGEAAGDDGATSGPIVGSLISKVGIVETATGIELVQVGSGAEIRWLAGFRR